MRIAIVGGMDRLQQHYQQEAAKLGVKLRVFNRSETNLSDKLKHTAAVVLFTGKISHQARKEVMGVALANAIPVHMSHQCGICALRDCLNCLKQELVAPPNSPAPRKGKHNA